MQQRHLALLPSARTIAAFAIVVGCCFLGIAFAVANPAPWVTNLRPTEERVRARSADDPIMRKRIIALSPTVSPEEAALVVRCAYTTGRELAREWRVAWLAGVQNFLVNIGARKGGLCFQWAHELLIRLNALKLQTLDLHWAESYAGTSGEHNVIVVTANGQAFEKGIILDNWRYAGHLIYGGVTTDPEYIWTENPAEFARRLKSRPVTTSRAGPSSGETTPAIPR
jgi:hypothetical protein